MQAADHFVRVHTGETRVGAVDIDTSTPSAGGHTGVDLVVGSDRWCVHVTSRPARHQRLTSCADGGTYGTPAVFGLLGLRRLA